MDLKPLSLMIAFRSNYADKLDNDTQILYWILWDKWNYFRRPERFNIDNNTLLTEANLKNYNQLNDKRKKLIEIGLIEYIPSKTRGKSSTYRLLKNYHENPLPNPNQNPIQNLNTNLKPNPITNLNETDKTNNDANSYDVNSVNSNLKPNLNTNLLPNPNQNLKPNPNKSNRDIENNILFFNSACARDNTITQTESQVLNFYQCEIVSALGGTMGAGEISCLREYTQVYGADKTIRALQKSLQCAGNLKGIALVKYAGGILRNWATYGEQERTAPKKIKSGRAIDSLRALMEG